MRRPLAPVSVILLLSLWVPTPAHAQLPPPELEVGVVAGMYTPSAPYPFVGASFGFTNPKFAVEVEYSGTVGRSDTKPAAYSITGNLIIKMPLKIGRAQFYGLGGIGMYAESYQQGHGSGALQALNFGAGANFPMTGPVSLRLEYRVYKPDREVGDPRQGTAPPQRFSAGLSFGF
jgi:Outer membrane protein beta-barrel domain